MSDTKETAGELLSRLGMDGRLWAGEFHKTAIALGHPAMDEGWLIGWFANAIMAGHDRAADRLAEVEAERDALRGEVARLAEIGDRMADCFNRSYIIPGIAGQWAKARAALTAAPAPVSPEVDIAAIENSGKRWHGEDHRVVSVRWEPYKPDGQRQMKAKGRWQECQVSGDFHRWTNCDRPAALVAVEARHE